MLTAGVFEAVSGRVGQAFLNETPPGFGGQSGLLEFLRVGDEALEAGVFEAGRALGGSSFTMPLDAAEGDSPRLTAIWCGIDYRDVSSEGEGALEWDGGIAGMHVGADTRIRDDLVAGLAVSGSKGRFDYTDGVSSGKYRISLSSVNPYAAWRMPNGLRAWVSLGYGEGKIEIEDDEASDISQSSAGFGISGTAYSSDKWHKGGPITVRLKAEGWLSQATADGTKKLKELKAEVSRLRAAVEVGHSRELASGGRFTRWAELGLHRDGGDTTATTGVETGAGVRYFDPPRGLTLEAHGRLLRSRGGDYREWGVGGLARLDPDAGGLGLSLSIRPTVGIADSGIRQLWENGAAASAVPEFKAERHFDAELGYGLPVLGWNGVLTPYGGVSKSGDGALTLSLGGRFEIEKSVAISLEGQQRESDEERPLRSIMLRGFLSW